MSQIQLGDKFSNSDAFFEPQSKGAAGGSRAYLILLEFFVAERMSCFVLPESNTRHISVEIRFVFDLVRWTLAFTSGLTIICSALNSVLCWGLNILSFY